MPWGRDCLSMLDFQYMMYTRIILKQADLIEEDGSLGTICKKGLNPAFDAVRCIRNYLNVKQKNS